MLQLVKLKLIQLILSSITFLRALTITKAEMIGEHKTVGRSQNSNPGPEKPTILTTRLPPPQLNKLLVNFF